jgi:3-hydroxybutyryl-CoA dehydratase
VDLGDGDTINELVAAGADATGQEQGREDSRDAGAGLNEGFPRERFSSKVTLTPAAVSAYSLAAAEPNPMHHDAVFAACMRYGSPIASRSHTTTLLLGLTAAHYFREAAMVGFEFWVRFRRPIYAMPTIRFAWSGWL